LPPISWCLFYILGSGNRYWFSSFMIVQIMTLHLLITYVRWQLILYLGACALCVCWHNTLTINTDRRTFSSLVSVDTILLPWTLIDAHHNHLRACARVLLSV
jgi:hypothetical protein